MEKGCRTCKFIAYEPNCDLFCVHPEAIKLSSFGKSFAAMNDLNLCKYGIRELYEKEIK